MKKHVVFFCIMLTNTYLIAQPSHQNKDLVVKLRNLIELVKVGKSIDEALNEAESLLQITDPDIKKYVYELNVVIAKWCIDMIESAK